MISGKNSQLGKQKLTAGAGVRSLELVDGDGDGMVMVMAAALFCSLQGKTCWLI